MACIIRVPSTQTAGRRGGGSGDKIMTSFFRFFHRKSKIIPTSVTMTPITEFVQEPPSLKDAILQKYTMGSTAEESNQKWRLLIWHMRECLGELKSILEELDKPISNPTPKTLSDLFQDLAKKSQPSEAFKQALLSFGLNELLPAELLPTILGSMNKQPNTDTYLGAFATFCTKVTYDTDKTRDIVRNILVYDALAFLHDLQTPVLTKDTFESLKSVLPKIQKEGKNFKTTRAETLQTLRSDVQKVRMALSALENASAERKGQAKNSFMSAEKTAFDATMKTIPELAASAQSTNLFDTRFKIDVFLKRLEMMIQREDLFLASALDQLIALIFTGFVANMVQDMSSATETESSLCEYSEDFQCEFNELILTVQRSDNKLTLTMLYRPWFYALAQSLQQTGDALTFENLNDIVATCTYQIGRQDLFHLIASLLSSVTTFKKHNDVQDLFYRDGTAGQMIAPKPLYGFVQTDQSEFKLFPNTDAHQGFEPIKMNDNQEPVTLESILADTWTEFRNALLIGRGREVRLAQGGGDDATSRVKYKLYDSLFIDQKNKISNSAPIGGARGQARRIFLRSEIKAKGSRAKPRRVYADAATGAKFVRMGGQKVFLSELRGKYVRA